MKIHLVHWSKSTRGIFYSRQSFWEYTFQLLISTTVHLKRELKLVMLLNNTIAYGLFLSVWLLNLLSLLTFAFWVFNNKKEQLLQSQFLLLSQLNQKLQNVVWILQLVQVKWLLLLVPSLSLKLCILASMPNQLLARLLTLPKVLNLWPEINLLSLITSRWSLSSHYQSVPFLCPSTEPPEFSTEIAWEDATGNSNALSL